MPKPSRNPCIRQHKHHLFAHAGHRGSSAIECQRCGEPNAKYRVADDPYSKRARLPDDARIHLPRGDARLVGPGRSMRVPVMLCGSAVMLPLAVADEPGEADCDRCLTAAAKLAPRA